MPAFLLFAKTQRTCRPRRFRSSAGGRALSVACALWTAIGLCATGQVQTASPATTPDPLMSLMLTQPKIDVSAPVQPTASVEPALVRPGQEALYQVVFNALEDSIEWPAKLPAPAGVEARLTAQSQIMSMVGAVLQPRTTFNCRVRASRPGQYAMPEFSVNVYGQPVTVPAVRWGVAELPGATSAQLLTLELSNTNPYVGEAVLASVRFPLAASTPIQALGQVQIKGQGFVVDSSSARQRLDEVVDGRPQCLVYEVFFTPIATGRLSASAQGYAVANRFFGGGIVVGPASPAAGPAQYNFMDSDPVTLQVRPLPPGGELPGFTGAVGTSYRLASPELSASNLVVGTPVKLRVRVHGEGNLARLVPPPPPLPPDWQVFAHAAEPVAPQVLHAQGFATFSYTLVPLTETAQTTPAIPFSVFDTQLEVYRDLTIPPLPVTIRPGLRPADYAVIQQAESLSPTDAKEPALSGLAAVPGMAAHTLVPFQNQAWFPAIQLAPGLCLLGLWLWDRRRRYLEQHPEVVLRARARRSLRREWRTLRKAARLGDSARFGQAAVAALRAACAPHYPADARALVGGDVIAVLPPAVRQPRMVEVVRRFFVVTDAARFGTAPSTQDGLLDLHPELEHILHELEAGL